MQVGFSSSHRDSLITRQACIALTQLATMPEKPSHTAMQPVYKALTRNLLSDILPDSTWYTAAEAAVTAVYALHPAPQELAQVVVHQQGKAALQSSGHDEDATGVRCNAALVHVACLAAAAVQVTMESQLLHEQGRLAQQSYGSLPYWSCMVVHDGWCVCVLVCVCVFLFGCVCVCMCVCVYLCLSVCLCVYLCSVCLYVQPQSELLQHRHVVILTVCPVMMPHSCWYVPAVVTCTGCVSCLYICIRWYRCSNGDR